MTTQLSIMIFYWLLFSNFLLQIWATKCKKIEILEIGEISCDLKNEILKTHNEIRQKIANGSIKNQPPAANMREMYWDEELAEKAQKWANQCKFAHSNVAERRTSKFNKVGQNIAINRNRSRNALPEKDFITEIHKWLQEGMNYKFTPLDLEQVKQFGHYTQLAWANTHLVGCGYSQFRINNITSRLYVCNYAASGNNFSDLPYIPGDQKCSEEFTRSTKYPSLCSTENTLELSCESEKQLNNNDSPDDITLRNDPKSSWDGQKSIIKEPSNEFTIDDFKLDNIKPDVNQLRDGVAITNLQVDKMYNILYF
ncbi:venom allergen 5-like [Chelonus insularis]|uniref:venom allergen 5-like n=1 Tax=Chelonus insularis TaxID=460826 RepID=UPI00158BA3B3|nr:venom allergen 5-like [Chelonus insularis]